MAGVGDDATLIKVAVFGIAMSIMATCMIAWYINGSSEYDYDEINAYKSQLVEYTGGQLVNDTPWVLDGVFTPFRPNDITDPADIQNHIEYDNGRGGWLYGEKITTYPDLNKATDIHLDKTQKSNQLLTVGTPVNWQYANGKEWWAGGNDFGIDLSGVGRFFVNAFTNDDTTYYGYKINSGTANNWNYQGYRYCFNPVLPFANETSSKDGRLSLVWYDIQDDTGLSGALEVYGSNNEEQILLGRYSAYDIIQAFQSSQGYVQVFDFNFEGTHLHLTIRFDPTVFNDYVTLLDAWNDGAWSLSISSASAGNFFDVDDSNAFTSTAGTTFDTFIQIFTFKTPQFQDDPWVNTILWLLVGLPMSMALLCVTLRVVGGVFKIF